MVNVMLYPDCPACGSDKVRAREPKNFGYWSRAMGTVSRAGGPMAPIAALAAAGAGLAGAATAIYQRVPGGGEKICGACSHVFR